MKVKLARKKTGESGENSACCCAAAQNGIPKLVPAGVKGKKERLSLLRQERRW
jgi:hypothetical protein